MGLFQDSTLSDLSEVEDPEGTEGRGPPVFSAFWGGQSKEEVSIRHTPLSSDLKFSVP